MAITKDQLLSEKPFFQKSTPGVHYRYIKRLNQFERSFPVHGLDYSYIGTPGIIDDDWVLIYCSLFDEIAKVVVVYASLEMCTA